MKVKLVRYATNVTINKGIPGRESDKQAEIEWEITIKDGYVIVKTETKNVYIGKLELK